MNQHRYRWLASRWIERGLALALILALVCAVWAGALLWQHTTANARIEDAAGTDALSDTASPAEKIVRAVALSKKDDSEGALELYQDVESTRTTIELNRMARFNSANQYLRDGVKLRATISPGRAIPLLELAKQTYRSLLLETPDDWAVRYNLASALTLLPDPAEQADATPPRPDAERAVTTMRGYSPGLP